MSLISCKQKGGKNWGWELKGGLQKNFFGDMSGGEVDPQAAEKKLIFFR